MVQSVPANAEAPATVDGAVRAPLDAGVIVTPDAGPQLALPFLDEKPPAESLVEAPLWMKARGVSDAQLEPFYSVGGCAQREVGEPRENALVCEATEGVEQGRGPSMVYRILGHRKVWVVRQKRPVAVLDVVYIVAQLDKEDASWPNILDLELELDATGMSAVLRDRQGGVSCSATRPHPPSSDPLSVWDRFDETLIKRACANRGTFVWRQGRFVRR